MAKKITDFKTRGMNRDLSVSAFNPEFSFENHNLRLSTNDGNTLMSWVNEKGTEELIIISGRWIKVGNVVYGKYTNEVAQTLPHADGTPAYENIAEAEDAGWEWERDTILGTAIGTAIINNQLVLFTHLVSSSSDDSDAPSDGDDEGGEEPYTTLGKFEPIPNLTKATKSRGNTLEPDRIYLIKYTEDKTQLESTLLFEGDLNFDVEHPIETLVSYEGESIQKVYWTDGKNQPRFINIAQDPSTYYKAGFPINDVFDFVRELNLQEVINVTRVANTAGEFPAGVIQYAFTYYNKYGQESNIFYTTPLYYISHLNRGGAPDDKVANAFKLSIRNIDTNFDYIRIYSIVRTSLNATPIVKRVQDLKIYKTVFPIDPTAATEAQKYLFTIGELDKDDILYIFTDAYTTDSIQISTNLDSEVHDPEFNSISDYTEAAIQLPPAGTLLDSNDYQNPHIVTINAAWDANNVEGDELDESTAGGSDQPITPTPPVPAPDPSDPSYYYKVDETNHTAGFYNPTSTPFVGEVTILSTVELDGENYTVVEISDNTCYNNTGITKITMPNTLTDIGRSVFEGCSNIEEVVVSNALNVIGDDAFNGCKKIEAISLPNSVTYIGLRAFSDCTKLTTINLPQNSNYKTVNNELFKGCTALSKISFPPTVTKIEQEAFANSGLTEVIIPKTITTILENAFSGCTNVRTANVNTNAVSKWFAAFKNVENVVIGDDTSSIAYGAFDGCTKITSLVIGSKVTSIGKSRINGVDYGPFTSLTSLQSLEVRGASTPIDTVTLRPIKNNIQRLVLNCRTVKAWFDNNGSFNNLKDVTLGSNVKTVEADAFFACNKITTLSLGANITSIGSKAFYECSALNTIMNYKDDPIALGEDVFSYFDDVVLYVPEDSVNDYSTADNWSNFGTILGMASPGGENPWYYISGLYYRLEAYGPIGNYDGEVSYGPTATVIAVPEEETRRYEGTIEIPDTVFFGNTTYTVTAIDSNLLNEDGAFAGCTGLTSITIPDSVRIIGENAFNGCTSLESVVVGRNVSFVGIDAFKDCESLEIVVVKDLAKWCDCVFDIDEEEVNIIPYSNPLSNDNCNLYDSNRNLVQNLEIPYGVVTVNSYAFWRAESIVSVSVPSSVRIIKNTAFENCDNIKSVYIDSDYISRFNPNRDNPNSTVLRHNENESMSSTFGDDVERYVLGPNVITVGQYAFAVCIAMTSIELSENIQSIRNNAFNGCTGLTSIDLCSSSKLASIDHNAFEGCTGLTSLTVPNSVTAINYEAFKSCTGIQKLILGKGLTSITSPFTSDGLGESAFYGCVNLKEVTAKMVGYIPPLKYDISSDKNVFAGVPHSVTLQRKLTIPPGEDQNYADAYWTTDVFGGGVTYPKDPRFAEGEAYYYIFEQNDYENLIIKLGESYYTWGKDCQDAILYFYPAKTKFDYINTKNALVSLSGPLFICEQPTIGGGYEEAYLIKVNKVNRGDSRLEFIDTNTSGEIIDPTSLLYLGGEAIIAQTIEQKDNTLFLGNITTTKKSLGEIKNDILADTGVSTDNPLITTDTKVRSVKKSRPYYMVSGDLSYINTLTCPEGILDSNNLPTYYQGASGFKSNEYYRLGVQFQDKTGKWSEPCWIGDKQWSISGLGITSYGPEADWSGNSPKFNTKGIGVVDVPEFEYTISSSIQEALKVDGYKRMRAVYAVPNNLDRTIICQGVICPTMYRDKDRTDKTVYAQSSWLFRAPFNPTTESGYIGYRDIDSYVDGKNTIDTGNHGGAVEYRLDLPFTFGYIKYGIDGAGSDQQIAPKGYQGGHISWRERTQPSNLYEEGGSWNAEDKYWFHEDAKKYEGVWMPYYRSTEIMGYYSEEDRYRIDNYFGTLHSPDIEFESITATTELKGFKVFNVGYSTLTNTYGDIDIQTVTPAIGASAKGFVKNKITTVGTSALVSGNFYEDNVVACWHLSEAGVPSYVSMNHEAVKGETANKDQERVEDAPYLWPVYMWHRKGSLNNDVSRDNRSAELKKKIISNYRSASHTIYNQNPIEREYTDMQFYNFTESSQICKVNNHIYQGCIDTMLIPSQPSDFFIVGANNIKLTRKGQDVVAEPIKPEFTGLPYVKLHQDSDLMPNPDMSAYFATDNGKSRETIISAGKIGFSDSKKAFWYGIVESMDSEFGKLSSKVSGLTYFKDGIPIKYKSTPHIAIEFDSSVPGAKQIYEWTAGSGEFDPAASAGKVSIVEIRRDYDKNTIFGGTTTDAFQAATWIPCGPVVNVNPNQDTVIEFKWGDTYFQRYECLKTYSYTPEDINQVIEIGSFMLETRTNIDGRYDRNRGMTSNLAISPQNFNLINPVYSQMDNFFSYKILSEDSYDNEKYVNQVTWTKTKESGAEVDLWTNITLASILELDGTCGQLNKLIRFSDQLIAFQDTGISQILYNDNTQISTTEGVPIEIANSGKVTGKRYFTNTVGCSNKWSISRTPAGLYFLDSNDKSIYIFGGDLSNLSGKFGFNTWCKKNIPSATVKWCPPYEENDEEKGFDNFVTYYDRLNQDVLIINKETALAFSEKVGAFTSFYDYGNSPYFCNLEDTGIWVKSTDDTTVIWRHQTGEYCRFFDKNYPYYITLVGNPEPKIDKIFTNIEFRACIEGEPDAVPFDSIEVWDEYQHGIANLSKKNDKEAAQHNLSNSTASLNRKFRMWRCDIPRDNAAIDPTTEAPMGITRHSRKPLDRMRNPWIYLKLMKNATEDYQEIGIEGEPWIEVTLPKTEVHDFIMTYYN